MYIYIYIYLQYINQNNILATKQCDIRNNSSTERKNLFKLINEILLALINQITVGRIFCDLDKAFDSIGHDILLSKCEFYGLRGETYALLCSYLRDGCQRVLINNSFSNNTNFQNKTWCSSSFNTWSLFFLIYINDLPNIIQADPSNPILFADDTSIIITNASLSKFKEYINNISDIINDWHNFLGQFCIQL